MTQVSQVDVKLKANNIPTILFRGTKQNNFLGLEKFHLFFFFISMGCLSIVPFLLLFNRVCLCFPRTNWNKAVQMCSKAREFALALAILECAIKPVVMLPVWKDSLGHTR